MDEKESAVKNFLGEFADNNETVNPFETDQKDPFAAEETQEQPVVKDEDEKPLPFHKDPKVQKFIDKEIEKRLKDIKPSVSEKKEEKQEEDDYYVRLIGNDTPEKLAMVREARARDERMLQQAEERAFNRLSQREQEALKADQEAEQELESAFDNIEETYSVDITSNSASAKKTRQEFVSFVEKIAPKDAHGDIIDYPDMTYAWETFQDIQKAKQPPSRAKELASRGMNRSAETTTAAPQKRVSWDTVDEFMDTLK